MIRDPLYRDILDGLDGRLDPELFEQCSIDLLRREAFPALVPIRGGSDAGMDGAVADGEGPAYPLVCTTGKDVIGNLTRSLDSYLADDGSRRLVVVATSQALTQKVRCTSCALSDSRARKRSSGGVVTWKRDNGVLESYHVRVLAGHPGDE